MFLALFVTLAIAVGIATAGLVTVGHRVRFSSRTLAIAGGLALAVGVGEIVARVTDFVVEPILVAELVLVGFVLIVAFARPRWNPIGVVFFAAFLAAAVSYFVFATYITFTGGMSVVGTIASALLLALEIAALTLAGYFVYEGCDIICRVRATRPDPSYDADHRPKVSLQVPAYNEPPDMLIDTIKSLDAIDYPNLEIIVIDNNTDDPSLWEPVQRFCADRPRVKFIHEEGVPGFKAGALNLVMAKYMDADVEIIGIVDADYKVDPNWLKETVGYFVDPNVAFVQTPQDYRDWQDDPYLTACYDAYRYFFCTTMPARDQRNSIIFAGTMGLIRRSALDEIGGWPEWCITEDAETSFRILKKGHEGRFVPKPYGIGVMPLTFSAFKGQRFRWAFGGIQILRKHWTSMLPGRRTSENRLSFAQRFDYLMSGFLWFNDLLYLGFSLVLFATAFIVMTRGSIELRPLRGAIVLLPGALIASGVIRALWSLRVRTGIGWRRALFAFLNWLSCSWVTALACLQHLFRSDATFLRTPKEGKERSFWSALKAARIETIIAALLWGAGLVVVASGRATAFLAVLFAWQGLVYASSPLMSYLNVRTELSPELERRRRSEYRRERFAALAPYYAGAAAVAIAVATVFAVGGTDTPDDPRDLFNGPRRTSGDRSPLAALGDEIAKRTSPEPTPAKRTPAPTGAPAPPTEVPVGEDPVVPTDEPVATDPPAETSPATDEPPPATDPPPSSSPAASGSSEPSSAPQSSGMP